MRASPWLLLLTLGGGCTIPDGSLGTPSDAGRPDTGAVDAGAPDAAPEVDAGRPPDAGPGPDASLPPDAGGTPDAGPECGPGDATTCLADEVLRTCLDGRITELDCPSMGAFCDSSALPHRCAPRVCEPSRVRCDADTLRTCDDRGAAEAARPCPFGCDPARPACRPEAPCPLTDVLDISIGDVVSFDSCAEMSVHSSTLCPRRPGREQMFRLVVREAGTVRFDLRDVGDGAADVLLHVRTRCDDGASEIACHDDVPCASSPLTEPCLAGVQPRHARLDLDLEPGTYYVVADTIEQTVMGMTFDCSTSVRLEVSAP